ncbi:MAG: hypothetical protein ACOC1L_02840 [Bacillota bacterium]
MKRLLSIIITFTLLFTLVACGNDEHAGRYNLTSITGIPSVTAEDYDYNYIKLDSRGNYTLENKIYGTKTSQTGEYEVDGETLIVRTEDGDTTVEEKYIIKDGQIIIDFQGIEMVLIKEE